MVASTPTSTAIYDRVEKPREADSRVRRIDPFRVPPRAARARQLEAYHEHLRERDGEINYEQWSLPRREARMAELRQIPVASQKEVDRDAFYKLLHRVGEPKTNLQTLWAALAALANEGERYGVELETEKLQPQGERGDQIMTYHVIQEDYHTGLLLEACRLVGLEGVTLRQPRALHRWIIRSMAYMPDSVRYVLILVGEAVGTVALKGLHDTADLFTETEEAAEHLRSILAEILYDECLHTVHCRSRIGKLGGWVARALTPIAAFVVESSYPQFRRLGLDRRNITESLRRGVEIPAGVDWVEPDMIS